MLMFSRLAVVDDSIKVDIQIVCSKQMRLAHSDTVPKLAKFWDLVLLDELGRKRIPLTKRGLVSCPRKPKASLTRCNERTEGGEQDFKSVHLGCMPSSVISLTLGIPVGYWCVC